MNLILFTDSKKVAAAFEPLGGNRGFTLDVRSLAGLGKDAGARRADDVLYIDVSGLAEARIAKLIRGFAKKGLRCGLVDPNDTVSDPAKLLREGAADYIGKALLKAALDRRRFKGIEGPPASGEASTAGSGASRRSESITWADVALGREADFLMLYAELDVDDEARRTLSAHYIQKRSGVLKDYLQQAFGGLAGRVWIWRELGGLLLFPFDGKTGTPIQAGVRLIIDRTIANVEQFGFNLPISYHLAFHAGRTIYLEAGDTGSIISETVNFVFHLGQRFTGRGDLVVTGEVFAILPKPIRSLFIPTGTFEGRQTFRMRRVQGPSA